MNVGTIPARSQRMRAHTCMFTRAHNTYPPDTHTDMRLARASERSGSGVQLAASPAGHRFGCGSVCAQHDCVRAQGPCARWAGCDRVGPGEPRGLAASEHCATQRRAAALCHLRTQQRARIILSIASSGGCSQRAPAAVTSAVRAIGNALRSAHRPCPVRSRVPAGPHQAAGWIGLRCLAWLARLAWLAWMAWLGLSGLGKVGKAMLGKAGLG